MTVSLFQNLLALAETGLFESEGPFACFLCSSLEDGGQAGEGGSARGAEGVGITVVLKGFPSFLHRSN